jgi:hypothetical protein
MALNCYKISGAHRLYYMEPKELNDRLDTSVATAVAALTMANYIGDTGEEGIRLNRDVIVQDITSDQLGKSIVDGVYQGANVELEFVAQDVIRDAVVRLLYPWQVNFTTAAQAVSIEKLGDPGAMACAASGLLVAYPIPGTTAFTAIAGSAIANYTARAFMGVSVGPVSESLDTTPRFIPVRFRCIPFWNDTDKKWRFWEWTSNTGEPWNE